MNVTAEQYLESLMPTRAEVEAFLVGNGGVQFDGELGWIHAPTARQDGVSKSKTFYEYEPDRARRVIHHAGRQCRIHTFGNSFTHCDQVSDGETWQEYLAAHLQEPIRNYGVGGYSVYQAYARMKRVAAGRPVPYVILNIYDHDHHRNLFSWWAINFGQRVECGFPCPRLKVDVRQNRSEEMPNLVSAPDDVFQLCDRDWVIETFRHDPILPIAMVRHERIAATWSIAENVAASFGLAMDSVKKLSPAAAIERLSEEAALFSTQQVVKLVEEFARCNGSKLFVVLSHCMPYTANVLAGQPRWDQSFLDFIHDRGYPVLDMRDAFAAQFQRSNRQPREFLEPYYIGHHTPAGNFFTAWAIKDAVVDWLDPKPRPYRLPGNPGKVQHDGWKPTKPA